MKTGFISVLICVVVLVAAIGFLQMRSQNADERINDGSQAFEQAAVNASNSENNGITVQEEEADIQYDEVETSTESTVTVQSSFPIRTNDDGYLVIGSNDAPITITEFSSLSCSHCASFHNQTLGDLKTDYVDTGAVKMVFHDFPTNQAAMDASKLLRCVDEDDRYNFMNLLFEQQTQWALPSVNHRQKLLQYAALLGVSNQDAMTCMDDQSVENQIVAGIQSANADYGVQSTPTFLINPGEEILVGARPYGTFSSMIESLQNQAE